MSATGKSLKYQIIGWSVGSGTPITIRKNSMRTIATLSAIMTSVALLAACGTTTKLDDQNASSAKAAPAKPDSRTVGTVGATTVDPLNDPKGILAQRSIYFDFDNYIIKDEFKPVIEAHGKYLTNNKARKIVIQGNADERGGSEYNLALGQKRAEAVRHALASLGEPDSQMEAISYGKEKPQGLGHDEASWARNRRSDIVYSAR